MLKDQNYLATYNFSKYCDFLQQLKTIRLLNSSYFDDDFLSCAAGLLLLREKSFLTRRNFSFAAHQPNLKLLVDEFFALPTRCLTRKNFDFVVQRTNDAMAMTETLGSLCELSSLNDADWNNINSIRDLYLSDLNSLLSKLNASGKLNSTTLDFMVKQQDVICHLYTKSVLNQHNWDEIMLLNADEFMMIASHQLPTSLAKAFMLLNRAGILAETRKMIFLDQEPYKLAEAFVKLQRHRIVDNETRAIVALHPEPNELAKAFNILQGGEILADTREMVALHPNPTELALAFTILKLDKMVDDTTLAMVALHLDPTGLAYAFNILTKANIGDYAARSMVALHHDPKELAYSLNIFKANGIEHPAQAIIIGSARYPNGLDYAFSMLESHEILAETRDMVAAHPNPNSLAYAFVILKLGGIVDAAARAQVAAQQNPKILAYAFRVLNRSGILAGTRDMISWQKDSKSLTYSFVVLERAAMLHRSGRLDDLTRQMVSSCGYSDLLGKKGKDGIVRRQASLFISTKAAISIILTLIALYYLVCKIDLSADVKNDYFSSKKP